jgi:hypothetical protein
LSYTAEPESSNRYFQTTAAIIASMTGATINNKSWERSVPPAISAGPRLRAGFTDVPVMGMLTIWIIARERPVASCKTGRSFAAGGSKNNNEKNKGCNNFSYKCRN